MSLENLREDYRKAKLDLQSCETNPIVQFERWVRDAQAAHLKEPNAMTVSTATSDGKPSARVLLLKEVSDLGFVFYTNYRSRKAQECETNPFAALTFYWAELERQVRVEGRIHRISREQSVAYFNSRPRGSRLGALASPQSQPVPGRGFLEQRLSELNYRYSGIDEIPTPEWWGGYCVEPQQVEFWQGRSNRLHDRIQYRVLPDGSWARERLAP